MEVKLNSREIELLNLILHRIVIKNRTGELGIIHGSDRFITTNIALKAETIEEIELLYRKVGLARGLKKI